VFYQNDKEELLSKTNGKSIPGRGKKGKDLEASAILCMPSEQKAHQVAGVSGSPGNIVPIEVGACTWL
jgi:hypothetical protein